jgi:hypothetical protein
MSNSKSFNLLKYIVITMGIILIIGMLIVFKLVFNEILSYKKYCNNQELNLKDMKITNMSVYNKKIFLHLKKDQEEKIIFFDYCNHQKINQIIIKNDG